MSRTKAILKVEVDLDDVPGWGFFASDYQRHIQQALNGTIGHYNPVVTLESCTDSTRMYDMSDSSLGKAFRAVRESMEGNK
jgi:hypothetical protein